MPACTKVVETNTRDGSAAWAQSVLNATVTATARITVPTPGLHQLNVYSVDTGVVLGKIVVNCGGLRPGYLGPSETRVPNN